MQIKALQDKIDNLQKSVERIRKIFFWTFVISIVFFVLPLIGLIFVIPQFLSSYTSALQQL